MIVKYKSIDNCKFEIYNGQPILVAPAEEDKNLLINADFLELADGRWVHHLTDDEYAVYIDDYSSSKKESQNDLLKKPLPKHIEFDPSMSGKSYYFNHIPCRFDFLDGVPCLHVEDDCAEQNYKEALLADHYIQLDDGMWYKMLSPAEYNLLKSAKSESEFDFFSGAKIAIFLIWALIFIDIFSCL